MIAVTENTPTIKNVMKAYKKYCKQYDEKAKRKLQMRMSGKGSHSYSMTLRSHEDWEDTFAAMERARVRYESPDDNGKTHDAHKMPTDIICQNLALHVFFTTTPSDDGGSTLWMWDYDQKVWTLATNDNFDRCVCILRGSINQRLRMEIEATLKALVPTQYDRMLAPCTMLPKWMIPVKNGYYNLLTKRLEDTNPLYFHTSRIGTDYDPTKREKPDTYITHGYTLPKLIDEFCTDAQGDVNRERVRLVEEIMLSAVVGCNPRQVYVVVNGNGGDGKSTMFDKVLGSVLVGQAEDDAEFGSVSSSLSNVAHLNFIDIQKPDRLIAAVGARMILGSDNPTDVRVRDDSVLKRLAAREVIQLSRKYMSSVAVRITGLVVQLTNKFPNIPINEANNRRIIPLAAENRFVTQNRADVSLDTIVEGEEFRKHALAYILNLPFRRDFNSCDYDLLLKASDNEDILSQFVSDLRDAGLFEKAKVIPTNLLYAAYLDWAEASGGNDGRFGQRAFTTNMTRILYGLGYKMCDTDEARRWSTFNMRCGMFKTSDFGQFTEGRHFHDAMERTKNTTTRMFKRVKKVNPDSVQLHVLPQRDDSDCSVVEYLGLHMREDWRSMIEEQDRGQIDRLFYNPATQSSEWPQLGHEQVAGGVNESETAQQRYDRETFSVIPQVAEAFRGRGSRETLGEVIEWSGKLAKRLDEVGDDLYDDPALTILMAAEDRFEKRVWDNLPNDYSDLEKVDDLLQDVEHYTPLQRLNFMRKTVLKAYKEAFPDKE